MNLWSGTLLIIVFTGLLACHLADVPKESKAASEILGNPDYMAFAYGGFREKSRNISPSVEQIKEDMKILSAMGTKIIRTYNTQLYPHASRTLKAIQELKKEDPNFEMYVMLGTWIECQGAWTNKRDHQKENLDRNKAEIDSAISFAQTYPDIVKVIAVGNESMVHWAESYFVAPAVILKYVEQLQQLKTNGELNSKLWITSSDNFASWGGGSTDYHNADLTALIKAVDYISMHSYPFHDSHYNPEYWYSPLADSSLSEIEKADAAMLRARNYAISQYQGVSNYISSLGVEKDIHIGETGWSSSSHAFYGDNGSHAADEYKGKLYYDHMRKWSDSMQISCFYFEAFDEQWKDLNDERASENHFGMINLEGEAKYAIWSKVDNKVFEGLSRGGKKISKTYAGDESALLSQVQGPKTIPDSLLTNK